MDVNIKNNIGINKKVSKAITQKQRYISLSTDNRFGYLQNRFSKTYNCIVNGSFSIIPKETVSFYVKFVPYSAEIHQFDPGANNQSRYGVSAEVYKMTPFQAITFRLLIISYQCYPKKYDRFSVTF